MSGRVSMPFDWFFRPDLCADHDHPGATYSPWMDQTVCLCGLVWQPGDTVDLAVVYAEPLWSTEPRPEGWERPLPGPVGAHCAVPLRAPVQLDLFGAAA